MNLLFINFVISACNSRHLNTNKQIKSLALVLGAFLFGYIQRLALYHGSYRFFPFCFQVQINSNLSLSFITFNPKVHALIYSINMRPCKAEGLITADRAAGKKRMSEKRDLN